VPLVARLEHEVARRSLARVEELGDAEAADLMVALEQATAARY
jgi:hypothetical protein